MSDVGNPEVEQQGPIAAPDLDGAVGWLNVASPISMAHLRGKVVILDFWTYGCINCMHILRDLKTLETRFPDELVVIGVHSPKFSIDLNSPWDLALKPGILIIAMAGPHQIWVIDLLHDQAYPYAGTGEEAKTDGPVNTAAFVQPSGLAIDGNTLYVADAESNVIRALELPPTNTVTTLAGGDLFKFGDEDGKGDAVRSRSTD
jgi:thiol-disulfide isomerase/thioredoxin